MLPLFDCINFSYVLFCCRSKLGPQNYKKENGKKFIKKSINIKDKNKTILKKKEILKNPPRHLFYLDWSNCIIEILYKIQIFPNRPKSAKLYKNSNFFFFTKSTTFTRQNSLFIKHWIQINYEHWLTLNIENISG